MWAPTSLPLRPLARQIALAVSIPLAAAGLGCGGSGSQNALLPSQPEIAAPKLWGPISGGEHGFPFIGTVLDLDAHAYVEEEFFIEGTARAFASEAPLAPDGRWTVASTGRAPYRTRVLVRRPRDAASFNGTVLVEWLNVSGGLDAGPDWAFLHSLILREGYAWVGVSAQAVGVDGFPSDHPNSALGNAGALKVWDATRYGPLTHPGDSYSYDMFTQVARALRAPKGAEPLGGAEIRELIAIGVSQSAARLVTYLNAVHPRARVYDAFFVHNRGAGSAPLSQAPEPSRETPRPARIRDDLRVPVLTFATETDLVSLEFYAARQPDTQWFRLWEVAGTAHADAYQLIVATRDSERTRLGITQLATCDLPMNEGPQHYAAKAAVHHLRRWTREGVPPPPAPRLSVVPGDPDRILRDGFGNAFGGIRSAAVDVPVAMLSGEGNSGGAFCRFCGVTDPFEPETLTDLYGDETSYRAAFDQAVEDSILAGFLLEQDAQQLRDESARVSITGGGLDSP